jgi:hypothetical protein
MSAVTSASLAVSSFSSASTAMSSAVDSMSALSLSTETKKTWVVSTAKRFDDIAKSVSDSNTRPLSTHAVTAKKCAKPVILPGKSAGLSDLSTSLVSQSTASPLALASSTGMTITPSIESPSPLVSLAATSTEESREESSSSETEMDTPRSEAMPVASSVVSSVVVATSDASTPAAFSLSDSSISPGRLQRVVEELLVKIESLLESLKGQISVIQSTKDKPDLDTIKAVCRRAIDDFAVISEQIKAIYKPVVTKIRELERQLERDKSIDSFIKDLPENFHDYLIDFNVYLDIATRERIWQQEGAFYARFEERKRCYSGLNKGWEKLKTEIQELTDYVNLLADFKNSFESAAPSPTKTFLGLESLAWFGLGSWKTHKVKVVENPINEIELQKELNFFNIELQKGLNVVTTAADGFDVIETVK